MIAPLVEGYNNKVFSDLGRSRSRSRIARTNTHEAGINYTEEGLSKRTQNVIQLNVIHIG